MLTKQIAPLYKKLLNPLVYDYLSGKDEVKPFYFHFPDKDGFRDAIYSASYQDLNRETLKQELSKQALSVKNTSSATINNIDLLLQQNAFTVTTGHQLCLFTGPLYFIYKIFSVINLCERLKKEFPENNFIPVYWLAGEDHDLDEIDHLYLFGKKIKWNISGSGAAGEISTSGLDEVLKVLKEMWGEQPNSSHLQKLFAEAYLEHKNLKDATRFLVNSLFGEYGLVIADGNSPVFKSQFNEYFKKDLFEGIPFKNVNESISKLEALNYEPQVNPREINCFFLEHNLRARLEREGTSFKVAGTEIRFTEKEIADLVETTPEKLSPNVVLRPCYQQVILPNIAYVGGPGELCYWLEYKEMFEALDLFFPVLMPRNSVMIFERQNVQRIEKMRFMLTDFISDEQELIKIFMERSNNVAALESYKDQISQLFTGISDEAGSIDATLKSSVESEKQKVLNSIANLEQKMNRALKQRSETELSQLKNIKAKLFPGNIPQERIDNFSMYYLKWGSEFMSFLKENLTYDLSDFNIVFVEER